MRKKVIIYGIIVLNLLCVGCNNKEIDLSKKYNRLYSRLEYVFDNLNMSNKVIGNDVLSYKSSDNFKYGKIKEISYENTSKGIILNVTLNLDKEYLYYNDFEIISTPLYDLSKVFIKEKTDYTQVNKQINKTIKNNSFYIINNEYKKYSNIKENIVIDCNEIHYKLTITS